MSDIIERLQEDGRYDGRHRECIDEIKALKAERDRAHRACEQISVRLNAAEAESDALRKAYLKMRDSAAGYSNFCEDNASTRRCEREYAEAQSLYLAARGDK